jgi:hypothetical protein
LLEGPIDRGLIEKLSTMMDPKNDNAYLTIDEFVDVGKKWLGFVKESQQEEENIENRYLRLFFCLNRSDCLSVRLPPVSIIRSRFFFIVVHL